MQGGASYLASGVWKVYSDVAGARKCFEMYKKCTRSLSRQLDLGKTLPELTVAM